MHISRSETGDRVHILQYFTFGWNKNIKSFVFGLQMAPQQKAYMYGQQFSFSITGVKSNSSFGIYFKSKKLEYLVNK